MIFESQPCSVRCIQIFFSDFNDLLALRHRTFRHRLIVFVCMWCHNLLLLLLFFCSNNQAELVSNYQEFFRFSLVSYCVYLFFIFIILLMGHRTSNPQPTDYQTINSNSNNNNNNDNNENLIKEIAREIMGFITIVNWIFHFLKSHICKLRLIFFFLWPVSVTQSEHQNGHARGGKENRFAESKHFVAKLIDSQRCLICLLRIIIGCRCYFSRFLVHY